VTRKGAVLSLEVPCDHEEVASFRKSAEVVRDAVKKVGF
jgi:hypothetical protein